MLLLSFKSCIKHVYMFSLPLNDYPVVVTS